MSSDIERWEPPNDSTAFESLCLDLFREIWGDSSAQKHGRSGQAQAGVDVFGQEKGRHIGVQCKQKDNRLWSKLTIRELNAEVAAAKKFTPKLDHFILATTAVRSAKLQKRAREITEEHRPQGLFSVEVRSWEDLWHDLYRSQTFRTVAPVYWPKRAALPPAPAPSLADLLPQVRPYLEFVAGQCQQLPLIGLDPKARETQLTLDAVYISLDTTASDRPEDNRLKFARRLKPESARPLTALQAVARHPRLVLKGDPGSGKSTFMSHLGLCLAKYHLEPDASWLGRLPDWPAGEAPIPISIVLREFVRTQPKDLPEPCPRALWEHFAASLKDHLLAGCASALEAALEHGHVVVFIDGLDEVPTDAQRAFARACILAFAEHCPRARLILTCRTIPYAALRLEGIPDFELAPFDDEKITAFIEAWHNAHVPKPFSRRIADERRDALTQAIGRAELRRLAGNPMLLTDMALLHTHRGRLPDDRAKLYQEVIELLLLRWDEARQGSRLQDLLREARRDEHDLLRTLGSIAFATHRRSHGSSREDAGDIPHHELLYALRKLHPDESFDWADRVIETVRERAGLLIAVDEQVFRFPHRSFQEYLAAQHLTKEKDFAAQALQLVDESGYWREVIKWAAGRITHVEDATEWKGFALLRKLCPGDQPPDPLPWQRIWLAGEALLEMSLDKVQQFDDGPELATRVIALLKQLVVAETLPPVERAQAAAVLGGLGDNRKGVGVRVVTGRKSVPDFAWTNVIEPGPFVMGSEESWQGSRKLTRHIAHPYQIGIFPVTVAQYALFISDGGYEARSLWTASGWDWRESKGHTSPDMYKSVFQTQNHPQVGVNWFEAMAFCRWLNASFAWSELDLPGPEWKVRLPTESEWERAARHTDGREFPWGNDAETAAQRCNCHDAGVGRSAAVGIYPGGKAECDALDLAGNVLEWCHTKWKETQEDEEIPPDNSSEGDDLRILRGGSWKYGASHIQCAVRFRSHPYTRGHDGSFRLVASSFLCSDL